MPNRIAHNVASSPRRARTRRLRLSASPLRAFTLIEVLLAIGVLSILISLFAISASDRPDAIAFDEGVTRFESMLRMLRAESANKGRRFRVTFEPATVNEQVKVDVQWEPQPLAQPGQYIAWTDASWTTLIRSTSLVVERCVLTGDSAYRTLTFDSSGMEGDESPHQPVTFHPDGSSDSATLELRPADASDLRRAVIELDGLNGLVQTRVMTSTQWAAYQEQQASSP